MYDYDAHVKLISTLRQLGDLEATRKARFRLNSLLLMNLSDWKQWIEDEISIISGKEDKFKVKELFEMALKDYPASINLWLEYLTFCKENPEVIEDLNKEISRASAFAAWNLQEVHKLLLLQQTSNPRAIPYTSAAKRAMKLDDSTPSFFESFEEKFPENIEKYLEAVKLCKTISASDKLTLCRVIFERAIEADTCKFQIWEDYMKYLRSEMNVSNIILSINRRLTRAHPLLINSWILLLENLELYGVFREIEQIWKASIPRILFEGSHENFLALQLAHLDYLRRQGRRDELILSFQTAIYDEEQAFGIDPQGRLTRYFSQILLKHGEVEKFRNVWQQLLKHHAKEAGFWLEYLQMERSLVLKQGDNDVSFVLNGFKRAAAAVSDYPETIFYEWLQFEKQHSPTLQSLLDARDRIEKQRSLLKEREEQRQLKEIKESNSRKRTRTVETTPRESKPEQPIVLKSFNPDATLFVNNLPFSFSENDIKSHFTNLISELPDIDMQNTMRCVISIRMHMNSSGTAFKGHATIEFDSTETAESVLETFNRRSADESGRPVFLAKYVSPLLKKTSTTTAVTDKSESDAKTLYVSNLPSKETIRVEELFKSLHGIQQVRHVQGKQFAFIEFESENFAGEALKEIPRLDKNVKAAFSKPPQTTTKISEHSSTTVPLLKPRSVSLKK